MTLVLYDDTKTFIHFCQSSVSGIQHKLPELQTGQHVLHSSLILVWRRRATVTQRTVSPIGSILGLVQQEDGGSTNLLPDSRLTSPRAKLTSASFNLYSSPSCLQVVQTWHLQRTQLVIVCNSLLTNDTGQFQHLPCKFQVRLILLFLLLSTITTFSTTWSHCIRSGRTSAGPLVTEGC